MLYEDRNIVCGICKVKGHDSNLTGNTAFSGFRTCIRKLREMVERLTEERDVLTKKLQAKNSGKMIVGRFNPGHKTRSFPEGGPQRESYLSDLAYLTAERKYDKEWRETYSCLGCEDGGCPQCGCHTKKKARKS